MKNPWTKKNPFMSMWLSGANAVLGRARGQASAAVKRETKTATTRGIGDMLKFWTKAAAIPATPTAASARKSVTATATTAATRKKAPAKRTSATRTKKRRK